MKSHRLGLTEKKVLAIFHSMMLRWRALKLLSRPCLVCMFIFLMAVVVYSTGVILLMNGNVLVYKTYSKMMTMVLQQDSSFVTSTRNKWINKNVSLIEKVNHIRETLWPRLNTVFVDASDAVFNKDTHIYEKNGRPFMFMYWNGSTPPAFTELCVLSALCHNHEDFQLYLLNATEFQKSVPYVHPAFKSLTPVHQADYYRAAMLNQYGGIYMDVDTLSFGSMKTKLNMLSNYDFIFGGDNYWFIFITPLGPIRAHTLLTTTWMQELFELFNRPKNREFLEKGRDEFAWDALMTHSFKRLLHEYIDHKNISTFRFNITKTWGQFSVNDLMSQRNLIPRYQETDALTLNNALYPKEYKILNTSQVLQSQRGLSQLLRLSLNSCWTKLISKDIDAIAT